MHYLLFFIYLGLITYFLPKIPFIRKSGLKNGEIRLLLLLKIFVGSLYCWLSIHFYNPHNDMLSLFRDAKLETAVLLHSPANFITNIFSNYPWQSGFWSKIYDVIYILNNNSIIKVLAVFNLASFNNIYINSIFFNSLCFFAHIALYRVYAHIYPGNKIAAVAGCFLLPSLLIFSSAILKDNVMFMALAGIFYGIYFSKRKFLGARRLLFVGFCFFCLLVIRNYVAAALVPALFAYWLHQFYGTSKVKTFVFTYLATVGILIVLPFLDPELNVGKIISNKQKEFLEIGIVNTQLTTDTLHYSAADFLSTFPVAVNHVFLRPYLWEKASLDTVIFALELFIYLALFAYCIYKHQKKFKDIHAFVLCTIIFSVSVLLLFGFIVPAYGAIIRYRSIFLPFIIMPLMNMIKFKHIIYKNI